VSDANDVGESVAGLFTTVDRQPSLADRVANEILSLIRSRELMPGARLPSEREFGERFGVSRTVVREAMRGLTARGVVTQKQGGRGLWVKAVDGNTVSESFELLIASRDSIDYPKVHQVRTMLEVQAAGLAAQNALPVDIMAMTAERDAMVASTDVEEAASHDVEFHRAIAIATHNELFLVLHDAIGLALMRVRKETLDDVGREKARLAHAAILDRIEASDVEGARTAMREHLEAVEALWRAHLETSG